MEGRCQRIVSMVLLFTLVTLSSLQSFERITLIEAALRYRNVSTIDTNIWKALMFSSFTVSVAVSPWLGANIGVQSVAKIGALISVFVAFCLWLIESYAKTDQQFIKLIQALAPFSGISDSMLAFTILAAFVNTTHPRSRGWSLGLMFLFMTVGFVLGNDHEGVLSSLQITENMEKTSFTLVCFIGFVISLIYFVLISLVNFESSMTVDGNIINSDAGEEYMVYRWWRSFSQWNTRWGCFVVFIFAVTLAYIKRNFKTELEINYDWDIDKVSNILLFGLLGFLLACPVVGTFGDIVGSLKVMMIGHYALAVALLVLAFVVDGVETDDLTVAFVTTIFGICSAPSVVMALTSIQDNLEARYAYVHGSVAASLYLGSWMLGILVGLVLEFKMIHTTFQEMVIESSVVQFLLGLFTSILAIFGILEQPIVEPLEKKLVAERLQKTPYVIENDWEAM